MPLPPPPLPPPPAGPPLAIPPSSVQASSASRPPSQALFSDPEQQGVRLRVTAAKDAKAEQEQADQLHEEVLDRAAFEARVGGTAATAVPPPPPAKQSSRARAAAAYSALKPFVIISLSYLLFTITDGAIRMVSGEAGGEAVCSQRHAPACDAHTSCSGAACMRRTDQLPLRGVGALPSHTAVPLRPPAPAAHRCLQIVLLHAYQKGFSAMEVATMFSFYEVRRTDVQSGGLAVAGPRAVAVADGSHSNACDRRPHGSMIGTCPPAVHLGCLPPGLHTQPNPTPWCPTCWPAAGRRGHQLGGWPDGRKMGHPLHAAHRAVPAACGHWHALRLAGGRRRGAGLGDGVQWRKPVPSNAIPVRLSPAVVWASSPQTCSAHYRPPT